MRKLTGCNGSVGTTARPQPHSFKGFVRTGDDAAGSKNRSCAQIVSRAIKLTLSAICNEPTATLDLVLVKQRLSAA
jgi:hypothetical protein